MKGQWGMRGRQIRRRSLLTTAGAAGMNAALIAACGGNKQEGSGNGGTVQDATVISTTPVAGQQGTPKPGGTLSLRANGNAPLDPYANSTFLAQTLASYTMARLMRFKTDLTRLSPAGLRSSPTSRRRSRPCPTASPGHCTETFSKVWIDRG